MPELPSQRQERFCQYAVTGMTDEQAYAAAGYKPNRGNPSRLKAKDSIRKRIVEIQREIFSKTQQPPALGGDRRCSSLPLPRSI
jgi:hypothetical protein